MSLRKWAYTKVTALTGFAIADENVFSSGAVGVAVPGDSPARPFAVIRLSPTNPGLYPKMGGTQQTRFAVWLHDEPGSMDNIDAGIKSLKALASDLPETFEGMVVMNVNWENDSQDFYDDHFGTNVMYSEFLATYKPAP